MVNKEPINDENDDRFIIVFVIHGCGSACHVKMKNSSFIQVAKEIQKANGVDFFV